MTSSLVNDMRRMNRFNGSPLVMESAASRKSLAKGMEILRPKASRAPNPGLEDYPDDPDERVAWWMDRAVKGSFPVLRSNKGAKLIAGVCRIYVEGGFTSARMIANFNKVLNLIVGEGYVDEYDINLNGMSARQLLDEYMDEIGAKLRSDMSALSAKRFTPNEEYEIVPIRSREDGLEFSEFNDWCTSRPNDYTSFDQYTYEGENKLYYLLKKGYEDVPAIPGPDAPKDEYGLSMIAIIVGKDGNLEYASTRWNHYNGGGDQDFTTEEISRLLGRNFYELFGPGGRFDESRMVRKCIRESLDRYLRKKGKV